MSSVRPLRPIVRTSSAVDYIAVFFGDTSLMATVDVILPAYNAESFLAEAIESVMAQTFQDWRIVLVNDGSTDGTGKIVAHYSALLGCKLLPIEKPNGGLPAARNTAIAHSDAPFLALLDADDIWLPQRLEASLASFVRPEIGLSYGFVAFVDKDGRIGRVYDRPAKHAVGNISEAVYTKATDLPCPTITFRRSCIDAVGSFDERLRATEDRDLWFRIASRYEVAMVPRVIAHYRTSPNAMTTDPERMLVAQRTFAQKHAAAAGFLAYRVAMSKIYRQYAEALLQRKRRSAALREALRAVAYFPFERGTLVMAGSMLLRFAVPRA